MAPSVCRPCGRRTRNALRQSWRDAALLSLTDGCQLRSKSRLMARKLSTAVYASIGVSVLCWLAMWPATSKTGDEPAAMSKVSSVRPLSVIERAGNCRVR